MADIDEVIAQAVDYSGELLEEARDLVNEAVTVSQGRAQTIVRELTWESQGDPSDAFLSVNLPEAFSDNFTIPSSGADLGEVEFRENYIPNTPEMPDAPDTLDTSVLFNITRPQWDVPDFTDPGPDVNEVDLPDVPIVNLPEAPEGAGTVIDVPEFSPPTFDDNLDAQDIAVVDVTGVISDEFEGKRRELAEAADSYANAWLATHCPEYFDSMTELENRISTAMQGGNAVDEEWEEAIYDRAKIRVNDEQHVAQRSVTEDYARRGFPIPPGAVMSALSRIRHESNRNLADVSGNIANQRAQIELSHLQFGMQISATLRQHFSSAMQNYMQLVYTANGQALQFATELGRAAAEVFNQRVELYRLEQQRYDIEARVYSVRLESSFALIRQFEVQIEAEKLKIEVDRNEIELYEARIRGELSKIELYNGQLQGVRTILEAESQKIDVYESQVRAYAARISGKSSEYDAYRAAIQGDSARVDAYQTEVQAYKAGVDAAATTVAAERSISESISDFNRQLIEQRDSSIRRYVAELQAEGTRFESEVDIQRMALARYTTEVEANLRLVVSNLDKDRLELQADIARVETNLRGQIANVESFLKAVEGQARVTNAGANIIGDMASSSLTTNNTILTQEE